MVACNGQVRLSLWGQVAWSEVRAGTKRLKEPAKPGYVMFFLYPVKDLVGELQTLVSEAHLN